MVRTSRRLKSSGMEIFMVIRPTAALNATNGWHLPAVRMHQGRALCHTQIQMQKLACLLSLLSIPLAAQAPANMYLRKEIAPLVQIFMLYPNYRGYLFADQAQ